MNALAKSQSTDKMLHVLSTGDLSKLSHDERLSYYKARCEHAGLDPLSVPFEWMTLQGKLLLYAKKTATDQLAATNKLKVTIVSEKEFKGVYVVRARAEAPDGRVKDEDGAVSIEGLSGTNLANALMKASTKAARRAVLSLTGLSMLDESEVETIPGVKTETPAARLVAAADVMPTPPSPEDAPPPEEGGEPEEFDEVSVIKTRISACTSRAQLLALVPDIKRIPSDRIAEVRAAYSQRQAELP